MPSGFNLEKNQFGEIGRVQSTVASQGWFNILFRFDEYRSHYFFHNQA